MDAYLEEQRETVEEFEANLERQVRDSITAQFVLDEIAKVEELDVDQDELMQQMVRRAQQTGEDPQEFVNHMVEHGHLPELVMEIRRGKALARVVESAVVTDADGDPGRAEEPAPRRHHRRARTSPRSRPSRRGRASADDDTPRPGAQLFTRAV